MDDILRTREVAGLLKVSEGFVRGLIRDKKLRAFKVGNRGGFRISMREVERFIASRIREAGRRDGAAPAIVKSLPPPLRRFVGDMSNGETLLVGMDVRPGKR
jgi:excisionase family DNA binding protein